MISEGADLQALGSGGHVVEALYACELTCSPSARSAVHSVHAVHAVHAVPRCARQGRVRACVH